MLNFERAKTYLTLRRAQKALTLNGLGRLYGVPRRKGESNRRYERRILTTASRRPPNLNGGGEETT